MLKIFFFKKKILENKDLIITLILRFLGMFVLFGMTIFMTRNFSANDVGDYDFSRTLLLLIGSVSLLGTDQAILYFSGLLKSKKSFHQITNLYKKIIILIFLMCIAISIIFFISPIEKYIDTQTYYIIKNAIIILFFYSLTIFNTEYLRALNFIYLSELFRNTFKYLPLIAGCFIILNYKINYNLVHFFYFGFIVLAIVTTLLCFYFNRKIIKTGDEVFIIDNNFIVKKSTPIFLSNMLIFINLSVDIFLLKKYYSSAEVAYYSTIMKLIMILSMVILAFNINLSPKISELYYSEKNSELQLLIKKNTKIVFLLNLFIALVLIIFGYPLLEFFGKEYSIAYNSLVILLITQIFCSFLSTAPVILNMIGKSKIYFYILFISMLLCITLNYLLIPKYSIVGASLSFLLTNIFVYICVFIYMKKYHKLSINFL